jgi:hypothetical protein
MRSPKRVVPALPAYLDMGVHDEDDGPIVAVSVAADLQDDGRRLFLTINEAAKLAEALNRLVALVGA